ncbi:MAG TPA: flavodoxin domain-containing protein [Chitinispirillaceae bacterium]|nr:flavodoxin domain-containing protein [Chitinispirillaceae bacterium]
MKTIVIYKSLSGFTRKYAQWISQELKSDLTDIKYLDSHSFEKYDTIIFGGSLHASGITGLKNITDRMDKLEGKNIVVFAVGASPSGRKIAREIINKNFNAQQQNRIEFFYLRGGFNFQKLDLIHKIIMTLFKWKLLLSRNKTPEMRGMLEAYKKPADFTKKENINDLVNYVKSLKKEGQQ